MSYMPTLCTTNACAEDPKPATHRLVIRQGRVVPEKATDLLGASLCDDCAKHWAETTSNASTPARDTP